ncbi:MAG: BsuBIPstI restriction endonuclease domain protein [Caulobacteraceae bacterium]|nr:BsuBIPstI restriction endonuclease domain protein [Caulobacteraceae bacterium]
MSETLLSREAVRERLLLIFPEGSARRGRITNLIAASTVFTALYIGAVEGADLWLGPKHVYRMTQQQAAQTDPAARAGYLTAVAAKGVQIEGQRWYQDNTRESIRDDTLREGLVQIGAVIERPGVATTAGLPRYALSAAFATLFDPALKGEALETAIQAWQASALNTGALARIAIVRRGAGTASDQVLIAFPNGETRRLKPSPSAEISKAVVEVFAPRFLRDPAVIFLSDSGAKVAMRDDDLARSIGLDIQADKDLPDIILADLGPAHPLLVFVEVVATDGPISERRKTALEALVKAAGFPAEHVAYVTAFLDRGQSAFKKAVDGLAWGSYAWFAGEPEGLVVLAARAGKLQGR